MITDYSSHPAPMNISVPTTQVDAAHPPPVVEQPGTSAAALSGAVVGAYEWFLELPVWVVLGVMWLVGVALIGSLALVLYWLVSGPM